MAGRCDVPVGKPAATRPPPPPPLPLKVPEAVSTTLIPPPLPPLVMAGEVPGRCLLLLLSNAVATAPFLLLPAR